MEKYKKIVQSLDGNFLVEIIENNNYVDLFIEHSDKNRDEENDLNIGKLVINKKNLEKLINYLLKNNNLRRKIQENKNYELKIPTYENFDLRKNLSMVDLGTLVAPLFFEGVDKSMLREYQEEGIEWLLKNNDGILADDMGLGKTLQSIKALDSLIRNGEVEKILIACPSSLISNWEYEIQKWAPHISITKVFGDKKSSSINWLKAYSSSHILITNYEQLRKDIKPLETLSFDLIIADEAHRIRKLSSQLSKGISKINRDRFWALTGTPIENNIDDLVSLLKHINPKKFAFLSKQRNDLILKESARPYVLRRLKSDVLKDLPEVIETNIPVELNDDQKKAYKKIWENKSSISSEAGSFFSVLGKLRSICEGIGFEESAKVDKALEMIENISLHKEKILIFSYYLDPLDNLEKILNTKKIGFSKIVGEDSREVREKNIEEFKTQEDKVVLLASSKVASEGLTLTEANNVIFLNKWWNPSSNYQARDRVVRIGQEKIVQVFNLFCVDTLEERVLDILEEKEEVYKNIVDGLVDEKYVSNLIEDEILN